MITAYCLWAFENAASTGDTFWFRISIVPFVIAVLRYALVIDRAEAAHPRKWCSPTACSRWSVSCS